jgi:hypothetical protein
MNLNKMDKSSFSISDLHDNNDEINYWKSKSPQERVQAIEVMRKILYGEDATAARLQRIFEITELKKD